MPELSLIIPSKNRPQLLRACLAHLRETIPSSVSYELLVGDASEVPTDDPSVVHLPGVPIAATWNRLAEKASGEFLMNLNDDTRLYPETVETALVRIRTLPENTVGVLFHQEVASRCHSYLLIPEFWIMRRDAFLSFHVNEGFRRWYADWDLGFRAMQRGYVLMSLAGACLQHVQPQDATYHETDQTRESDLAELRKSYAYSMQSADQTIDAGQPFLCPYHQGVLHAM